METTHEYFLQGGQNVLLSWGMADLKILPLDLALDSPFLIASPAYTTKSTMKNTNYFSAGRRIETDRLLREQYWQSYGIDGITNMIIILA
jgi:hypothetical protein